MPKDFETMSDAIKRLNSEWKGCFYECALEPCDPPEGEYPQGYPVQAYRCIRCGRLRYNSAKVKRKSRFEQLCPTIYQATVPHRLPSPTKLDKVLRWSYGPMGLILYGPSGTGKSRCAWLLMQQEMKSGKSALFLDASISYDYTETFEKNAAQSSKWISLHASCDLLLLDDVFKGKMTDGLEQAIYSIISLRTENERPTILTLNDIGETLLSRMSPDRGPSLLRRLREFCETVSFTTK